MLLLVKAITFLFSPALFMESRFQPEGTPFRVMRIWKHQWKPPDLQAMEAGTSDSAGMGDAFAERTQHMSQAHAHFLAHWLRLVDLEEGDSTAKRSEIWALPGET